MCPIFGQLRFKLSYKLQTNSFKMFISVQKRIEFHLPPYKSPQLCSHYWESFTTDDIWFDWLFTN